MFDVINLTSTLLIDLINFVPFSASTMFVHEGEVEVRFWNWDYEDPYGLKFAAEDGGTEITDCEKSFKRYIIQKKFSWSVSNLKPMVVELVGQ